VKIAEDGRIAGGGQPEVVMRLSEWRASAPAREAVAAKVAAVVDPVLTSLGADPDPHCWIAWGEEPASRFTVFVPTEPGLIVGFVRVNVPGDGPRAASKLVRWNKVSIGELSVDTQAGHRMLSFQLESQVLRGVDADADRAAAFALRVIAAIDGRPLPAIDERRARPKPAGKARAVRASAKAAGRPGSGGPSTVAGAARASKGADGAARTAGAGPSTAGARKALSASTARPKAQSNASR
jgi:hypothetical protein